MKFKTEALKDEFDKGVPPMGRAQGWGLLRNFLKLIDDMSVLFGFGEITITDMLRLANPNKESYHAVWQAADIRIHDKPLSWKIFMTAFGYLLSATNWRFQIYPHLESWGEDNAHFHIAIRIGRKG